MAAFANASERLSALTNGLISNLDSFTNLLTGGGAAGEPEYIYAHRDARSQGAATSNLVSGHWMSLWTLEGTPLPHGAVPTIPGSVPDNTTQGGLRQANPGGARTKLMVMASACAYYGGTLILYDRLWHCGGLDATSLLAQNVNGGVSGDVTRYTDGVGNLMMWEVYTQIGTTGVKITAAYKDGAGAAQTSESGQIGSARNDQVAAAGIIPFTAGGSTVKGITSVTLSSSTGTVGNFGVSIIHPLIAIPLASSQNTGGVVDFLCSVVPQIQSGACIAAAYINSNTVRNAFDFTVQMVEV